MQQATQTRPATASPIAHLTRQRKAAIIVQLLVSDGNRIALKDLPEQVQEDLTRELGEIRLVDRDTVNAVAEEFVGLLEAIGLSAPGDPVAALEALADLISPDLLAKLRDRLAGGGSVDPWVVVLNFDDATLREVLEAEDLQIGAILLSKLPVGRAATLLSALPGARARAVAIAVKSTGDVAPAAVARIGQALAASYGARKATAFGKAPSARMGDILNSASSQARSAMLGELEDADSAFAQDVRRAIFTFEDIPDRLEGADVPTCLRDVDQGDLACGIAYATAAGGRLRAAADFLLDNLSQRMAGQIRDAGEDMGEISDADGEAALGAIGRAIRTLCDSGDVRLKPAADVDDR